MKDASAICPKENFGFDAKSDILANGATSQGANWGAIAMENTFSPWLEFCWNYFWKIWSPAENFKDGGLQVIQI